MQVHKQKPNRHLAQLLRKNCKIGKYGEKREVEGGEGGGVCAEIFVLLTYIPFAQASSLEMISPP